MLSFRNMRVRSLQHGGTCSWWAWAALWSKSWWLRTAMGRETVQNCGVGNGQGRKAREQLRFPVETCWSNWILHHLLSKLMCISSWYLVVINWYFLTKTCFTNISEQLSLIYKDLRPARSGDQAWIYATNEMNLSCSALSTPSLPCTAVPRRPSALRACCVLEWTDGSWRE